MAQVMEKEREQEASLRNFARLAGADGNGGGPGRPWLDRLRKAGIERFTAVGLPGSRDEEWRFTSTAPLARATFREARADAHVPADALAAFSFRDEAAAELVFVNGHFAPRLSFVPRLAAAAGVRVGSLAGFLDSEGERLENYLGRHADPASNPFVALNTGSFRDGAYIHLARGTVLERPVHLLFLSAPGDEPTASHPRVLIVAEDGAQLQVVETYAGAADASPYFTNTVTEIVAAADARVEHCKVQQEGLAAYHVGTLQAALGRSAYLLSHVACLGAATNRNDLNVTLGGKGAEAMLNAMTMIGDKQHVDNHTLLDHAEAHCPSHELYKYVLDGSAGGVFKGKILVRPGAQKTDSKQTSKTLLLTDNATMNSQPALEIYADDVKCTHGSTTGPLDEQQVFYLQSRGLGLEAARHLLTYAFLAEVTGRMKVEPVRRRLEAVMAARHNLPQDLRIAE